MATDLAALRSPSRTAQRDVAHTVSPGLWTLAWRRLRSDRVGMVSLVTVAVFIVMMILSGTGLVASDWAREVGVNYAPPSFVGPDPATGPLATPEIGAQTQGAAGAPLEFKSSVVDPLGDVLAELKGEKPKPAAESAAPIAPTA